MMKAPHDVRAVNDPLRVARAAQRSARFDDALDALEGCEDWSEALAEHAALIKAETLGRRDPVEALAYLALAAHGDRRAHALARYAQGRIEQTLGRREAAVAALREAFEIFESASFHYRAVLAATALAELTGAERWRHAALAHAGAYPDCPLLAAAEHAGEAEQAMPPQLSPVQRQVARALWNGVDLAELSRRFSRSLYRTQRQVEAVYAAFGVATCAALYDEARVRGLA